MSEETTKTKQLPVQGKDIDSIMENLETGVAVLFTSDRYQEYLRTMAKFHRYSFNNTLLIAMQRPDAKLVTSYKNWQSMGRQVMRGEKGIMIIAPAPYKKMKEREILDQNQRPILGTDGKPKTEMVEVTIPHFKAITVFDIGQTIGEPIQTLAPEVLTAAVDHYDMFMEAIQKISPVPIRFDEISGNANVVIMRQNGNLQAFYVDRFGFAEVPEFVTQRQTQLGLSIEVTNQLDQKDITNETENASISFYAAECSEFPVLGEVHTDLSLEGALKAYENIPSERMNGIKSVGFDLKDGSDYEGMNDLLVGGRSQREFLDSIQHFKESPLVQNALTHVEKYIEKKQQNVENSQKKEKQVGKTKRTTKKKDNGEKELNTEVKKPAPKKKKEDLSL